MSSDSELPSEEESEFDGEYDSDNALQDALASGVLKPGLNFVRDRTTRVRTNNEEELKRRLNELRLALPWGERLDLVNDLAPLAPELALKLEETEQKRETYIKNHNANKKVTKKLSHTNDPVLNDFRREMSFHRQAQQAVLLGIPKLITAGILSKRPTDYFAQMAKSDEHMQKVRKVLLNKQLAAQRSEKAKLQRQTKKVARETQIASKLKQIDAKREMLAEVKKFRKGVRKDLDFLDDKKKVAQKKVAQKKPGPHNNNNKRVGENRKFKNQKFGFGGKRSGTKRNTKDSYGGDDGPSRGGGMKGGKGKGGAKGKTGPRGKGGKGGSKPSRPGKSKRQKGK